MNGFRATVRFVFLLASLLQPTASPAETVAVRYREGVAPVTFELLVAPGFILRTDNRLR